MLGLTAMPSPQYLRSPAAQFAANWVPPSGVLQLRAVPLLAETLERLLLDDDSGVRAAWQIAVPLQPAWNSISSNMLAFACC